MTPPNPSEAAREAAKEIVSTLLYAPVNTTGAQAALIYDEAIRRKAQEDSVAYTIQSAIDNALSASATRVKELEDALKLAYENMNEWCLAIDEGGTGWDDWDNYYKAARYGVPEAHYSDGSGHGAEPPILEVMRRALSIKVGETKP